MGTGAQRLHEPELTLIQEADLLVTDRPVTEPTTEWQSPRVPDRPNRHWVYVEKFRYHRETNPVAAMGTTYHLFVVFRRFEDPSLPESGDKPPASATYRYYFPTQW